MGLGDPKVLIGKGQQSKTSTYDIYTWRESKRRRRTERGQKAYFIDVKQLPLDRPVEGPLSAVQID